jgi:fucose 4-O-acetylase-like acetyltransferase
MAVSQAIAPAAPIAAGQRLAFVDNIRWVMIVIVICHHAAVTYSHVGGWYYLDGPEPPVAVKVPFIALETYDQAYFMGFLFLLAGYFVPRAFDAKGPLRFIRDRSIRLGIPSLIFMLIIHPLTVYWLLRRFYDPGRPPLTAAYPSYIASGRVLSGTGPMWFAVALLGFCCVYAVIRIMLGRVQVERLPTHKDVIATISLLAICTFAVRITQPIGANILNMQLCYFSQYVVLFALGILAYRGNWFARIQPSFALLWFKLALRIGMPGFFGVILASGALHGDPTPLLGGLHWQSALFSLWESFFCIAVCLGLTVLFRDHFNRQTPFTAWMAGNSFTAYMLHTPILIATTLALRPLAAPIGVKFLCASVIAVALTFCVSGVLRPAIPGLRRIL